MKRVVEKFEKVKFFKNVDEIFFKIVEVDRCVYVLVFKCVFEGI